MFKKFAPVFVMMLVLSMLLAACGNSSSGSSSSNSDGIPTYSGAKNIALTDEFKKGFTNYDQQTKMGAKLELYSTKDEAAKVKKFYVDEMKKNGWTEDISALSGSADMAKGLEQGGGFMLGFTKGDKGFGVIAFPGMMAQLFSVKDVSEKDLLLMTMTGPKAAFASSASK